MIATQELKLNMVGSSIFGRYPEIAAEQTWNLYIADGFMVPYPGYTKRKVINTQGKGREIYASTNLRKLFTVIDNTLYLINSNLSYIPIGDINTYVGDVFIAGDNFNNIAVCDKKDIWIYNPSNSPTFQKLTLDFVPGYICFQEGRFISVDLESPTWRLSDPTASNMTFPSTAPFVGGFQQKEGFPKAAIPLPGKGNTLLIIGDIGSQIWSYTGYQLFPYSLNQGISIDYGTLNSDTIAYNETYAAWLGGNEKSGAVIMYTDGGIPQKISTDGIDYVLSRLSAPEDSSAFMFRQAGHVFYQITFKTDNISLLYDFNTKKFYNICNSAMNYHIAKEVALFNNTYYFVSLIDGDLYEMNDTITTYNGDLIPRIRITNTLRRENSMPYFLSRISFPIEQGVENLSPSPCVDLSISDDGGYNFSNDVRYDLNAQGKYRNIFEEWNLGWTNDFVLQARFWSPGRVVFGNGIAEVKAT